MNDDPVNDDMKIGRADTYKPVHLRRDEAIARAVREIAAASRIRAGGPAALRQIFPTLGRKK